MIVRTKDILFFGIMTLLTIIAVGYGLSTIPSPFEQKDFQFDNKRINHLSNIQANISAYYAKIRTLPQQLTQLDTTAFSHYSSEDIQLNDPETKKPYEYRVTSKTAYKLCATFARETPDPKDKKKYRNSLYNTNYNYSSQTKFKHPKGYHCFDFEVKDSTSLYPYNTTWMAAQSTFKFIKPQAAENLCYGSDYTITWETTNLVKEVRLYITPAATDTKLPLAYLKPYVFHPAGQRIDANNTSSNVQGSTTWNVGSVLPTEKYNNQEFSFGVEAKSEDGRITHYAGSKFTISDCPTTSLTPTSQAQKL